MKNKKLRKTVKKLYGKGFVKDIYDKLGDGSMKFGIGDTLLYLNMIENARKREAKNDHKI